MPHSIARPQNQFRIINWFLIESPASGVHVREATGASLGCREFCWGDPSKISGKREGWAVENHARNVGRCSEVKMVLFSRAFIRKRVIALATTASVAATAFALAQDPMRAYHVRGAMPIQYVADRPDYSSEQPFLSENDAAMNKMMADMTIKPAGDVDRDFVAMMVPHHQGAIDMAKAELKYGHNEQLRRLAQQIVATQQREITIMQDAVNDGKSSAAQSPEQPRAVLPQVGPIDGSVARGGMKMSQ
ncbi:MAG: DUF305 domain-containing protein [Bradyrhizobium sp.]